jgi:putative transport protein
VEVLREQGLPILCAGALVTATPITLAFLLTWYVFRFDLSSCLGTVCGAKTSTPGLGAACAAMESDEPALAYAAIYPVALIAITAAAQFLASGF